MGVEELAGDDAADAAGDSHDEPFSDNPRWRGDAGVADDHGLRFQTIAAGRCHAAAKSGMTDIKPAMQALLAEWCDGLLRQQMKDPASAATDSAYACPACKTIHGRCADSVYPLLYMAQASG